jgi:WD40 repeat protein
MPLVSDRTIKVWSLDGISDDADQPINLKAKAVVAAHDKDINSLAIAPNDSLVCSGSQVSSLQTITSLRSFYKLSVFNCLILIFLFRTGLLVCGGCQIWYL